MDPQQLPASGRLELVQGVCCPGLWGHFFFLTLMDTEVELVELPRIGDGDGNGGADYKGMEEDGDDGGCEPSNGSESRQISTIWRNLEVRVGSVGGNGSRKGPLGKPKNSFRTFRGMDPSVRHR